MWRTIFSILNNFFSFILKKLAANFFKAKFREARNFDFAKYNFVQISCDTKLHFLKISCTKYLVLTFLVVRSALEQMLKCIVTQWQWHRGLCLIVPDFTISVYSSSCHYLLFCQNLTPLLSTSIWLHYQGRIGCHEIVGESKWVRMRQKKWEVHELP